ncbi:hypothetical protein GCM10022251_32220 [Phytohabitans flavus]|uniref:Uncharacterized protein n=1 Tax=Phytohabitans flavus TaxID=1076124 RepID=A0A6F8XWJ0_9ACTN|nr:hypothetical protein Pflav_045790 [Phytohabitans flavus]
MKDKGTDGCATAMVSPVTSTGSASSSRLFFSTGGVLEAASSTTTTSPFESPSTVVAATAGGALFAGGRGPVFVGVLPTDWRRTVERGFFIRDVGVDWLADLDLDKMVPPRPRRCTA